MVYLGGKAESPDEGMKLAAQALKDGRGLDKLREFIAAQGEILMLRKIIPIPAA